MDDKLLQYFKGDELASSVWKSKYATEGEETPDDMHRRMAREFGRIEEKYLKQDALFYGTEDNRESLSEYGRNRKSLSEDDIFNLFKDFKYVIPQGSIMATLGTKQIASLSNCWVVESPHDSYPGIHKTDGDLIYYYKRRGGVGVDISTLRPNGTATNNSAKSSTGAVSFMERFSNTTREVAMNGRRGALMISIDVNHPDVMDFIKVKRDGTSVTGANISVRVNNEFMEAVSKDEDYILRFPCDQDLSYFSEDYLDVNYNELLYLEDHKRGNEVFYIKKIKAREYWDEMIKSAHGYAEPGIMFWDNALDNDPAGVYEKYTPKSTNPCGEQFLQPNDSCRLMVTNLSSFIIDPFKPTAKFDYEKYYQIAYEAMRLGDALVDLEAEYIQRIIDKIKSDPEPDDIKKQELKLWEKSKRVCLEGRRVGMGITALGDTLAMLGLKYGSKESIKVTGEIMKVKNRAEHDCSIDLARIRGPFDGWDPNKEYVVKMDSHGKPVHGRNEWYDTLMEEEPEVVERMFKYGRRNISMSTIAPTGSVSLLANNCTSGCEPLFQPFYMRRKKINPSDPNNRVDFVDELGDKWQEFAVLHPKFKEWIKWYMHLPNMDFEYDKSKLQELFELSPWYGSTANDIDWISRVEMQAILQRYTTNAISSTVNLPSDVSVESVNAIYMEAWGQGLKGITVYRDGSRSGVLVSENESKKELVTFNENHAPKRPKSLACKVVRFNNNYEKWIAFVGLMDNKPYEIFTGKVENINIPGSIEVGEIKKVKDEQGKRYDFIYDGGVVENISNVSSSDYWNYGKLISGMLRHGMPLQFVVDTIQNLTWDEDHINTWKAGVTRAMKKFIKDGKVQGLACTDCGSESIIFEEGCSKCTICGSSKCN